jgi:hypothetical protein
VTPNKPLHPTADSASGVGLAFNSAVGELWSLDDLVAFCWFSSLEFIDYDKFAPRTA